ncbi:phosphotransferase [Paenibacillus illinoisensis]|uniref:Aminoglycoside phosphotransferase n=1 Tax=Paenibacillus illinoisensis TaxID=59845 RepID=A0A2W0C8R1_9BACL|nr:phosphotransferase [Paenibacillus illinoisensis]PYY26859.1 Aminoglycoside phosphotransferase [Paenibacillus illinoisensis]
MHNIHLRPHEDLEQQLIQEVISAILPQSCWEAVRGYGGMNNTTYMLKLDGERYVLRVYETHTDLVKVAFEHHVLSALRESDFGLMVPAPVKAIKGDGHTFYSIYDPRNEQYKIAALFTYNTGKNPVWNRPDQLVELGHAAGLLSGAMSRLEISLEPVYPPYYQIQLAYPLCPPEKLIQLCMSPPSELQACAEEMQDLLPVLPALFEALNGMERLPHQLVHGDVNASNVLSDDDGRICAILDFEFATWDLRVMELAVPMSDLLTMDKSDEWMWEALEGLIRGFRKQVILEPDELLAIPQLILLRSLDVVMHFISRMFEGTDEPEVAVNQIIKLRERILWMNHNEERLRKLLM